MSWTDDFNYLLSPVPDQLCIYAKEGNRIGNSIYKHDTSGLPDLDEVKLAIVGVKEGRRSLISGLAEAPDRIREKLYCLFLESSVNRIADLGNIEAGQNPFDTDAAVKQVVSALIQRKISVVVLGGSHELTYALHQAYEVLETSVNLCIVDQQIDLGEFREDISDRNYLSKIILHDPSYLFDLNVLGCQSYYADPESLRLMDSLFFDYHRLGEIKSNMTKTEPIIRNSDLVSIDMNACSNDAAPGTGEPNGFTGTELCQITRYAGLSDRTSVLGLFNYCTERDDMGQQGLLIAQAIWYFIQGFGSRIREYPLVGKNSFREYKVQLADRNEEMTFYKSKRTDKWWMKIPYSVRSEKFSERFHLMPCSYEDYLRASEGELPDLWLKTYRKLT